MSTSVESYPVPNTVVHSNSLNKNDVLCGRGSLFYEYPGSIQFRALVDKHLDEALSSPSYQANTYWKKDVAAKIVNEVCRMTPQGRFLEKIPRTPKKNPYYRVIPLKDALEKAKQALRTDKKKSETSNNETKISEKNIVAPKSPVPNLNPVQDSKPNPVVEMLEASNNIVEDSKPNFNFISNSKNDDDSNEDDEIGKVKTDLSSKDYTVADLHSQEEPRHYQRRRSSASVTLRGSNTSISWKYDSKRSLHGSVGTFDVDDVSVQKHALLDSLSQSEKPMDFRLSFQSGRQASNLSVDMSITTAGTGANRSSISMSINSMNPLTTQALELMEAHFDGQKEAPAYTLNGANYATDDRKMLCNTHSYDDRYDDRNSLLRASITSSNPRSGSGSSTLSNPRSAASSNRLRVSLTESLKTFDCDEAMSIEDNILMDSSCSRQDDKPNEIKVRIKAMPLIRDDSAEYREDEVGEMDKKIADESTASLNEEMLKQSIISLSSTIAETMDMYLEEDNDDYHQDRRVNNLISLSNSIAERLGVTLDDNEFSYED